MGLPGTWAHFGIEVDRTGKQPFFGLTWNPDDGLRSSIVDGNKSVLVNTQIFSPTLRPPEMHEGEQNNHLEMYFSVWLPSLDTRPSEVWLFAQLYTLVLGPEGDASVPISPLAHIPLSLCSNKAYGLTSIS